MADRFEKFFSYMKSLKIKLPANYQKYARAGFGPKARRFGSKIKFLREAVSLFFCATDKDTPIQARVVAFTALAYFVMPLDVIPDTIPVAGMVDDAAVIALAMWVLEKYVTDEHRRKADEWIRRVFTGKKRPDDDGPDPCGAAA